LSQAVHRAEDRRGRIPVEGRYHRLPKHVEDDYCVGDRPLGSGANGVVLMATNRRTGAKVAVKTLKLYSLAEEKKQELINEVEVFLCLDHPHVARLFEVYESEDTLSLVMECMEGGELYERVAERRVFAELDAAQATWQMLLSVNYLHSEGIVHRDLKLENFLYEKRGGDYLKLIDFGFSKVCEKSAKLDISCGTISYVAPEVLSKSYTSKCDLWSLGVIVFVLLSGYMPFSGRSDEDILKAIRHGKYSMKSRCWSKVSDKARDFVQRLLVVWPESRMSAEEALEHPWIVERHRELTLVRSDSLDVSIAHSLMCFARQTRFRRACMQLMAWSLSREERAEVRGAFLELDKHHTGVIKLTELKEVLEDKFHISEESCCSVVEAFRGLDSECDAEIHYSDFLAAMMSSRLALHDGLLREAFRHFDTQNRGYITPVGLRQVLGRSPEVDQVFKGIDKDADGRISVEELVAYLRSGMARDTRAEEVAHQIIDRELERISHDLNGRSRLLGPADTATVRHSRWRFSAGLRRKVGSQTRASRFFVPSGHSLGGA